MCGMFYMAGPDEAGGGGGRAAVCVAWAFGLTDEVFGAAWARWRAGRVGFSEPFMFGLGIGAYGAWLAGTAVGALAGGAALPGYPVIDAALGFMLPALFLALLLSILSRAQLPVIAVAGVVTVLGTLLVSGTTGILAGMVAGALAGLSRRVQDAG